MDWPSITMSRSKMDMAINLAEERRNHKVLAGLEHHIIQDELRGGLLNTLKKKTGYRITCHLTEPNPSLYSSTGIA